MHKLDNSTAKLALLGILICALTACGESRIAPAESIATSPIPPYVSTASPVPPLMETPPSVVPIATDKSCWVEWNKNRTESAFDCAEKEYCLAVEQHPEVAENHFRWGVLNWEEGQIELGREEILNAIRLDVLNKEYVEYLFGQVLPVPTYVTIKNGFSFYTEQFDAPHFIAQDQNVSRFDVKEVHTPKNVAKGTSAIRLTWEKPEGSWAGLIVGFDEDIADRQKALEGGLVSLSDLDTSNLDEYAIAFWAKGEGIQGNEDFDLSMMVKLQDQNLAVRESVGNQMAYDVLLTEKWTEYIIPLDAFYHDKWISKTICTTKVDYWDCINADLLYFDWSRVKQVNFDIPFYSTSGMIFLDEVRIIHLD